MASGVTNRGAYKFLDWLFRGTALPANVYVALVTSAVAPTADINTLGELTEIAAGNGYTTGGFSLSLNTTDFDTLTEDDTLDRALTMIKNVAWTASGGTIPASGNGARYAILTDNNATVGSRLVLAYYDLTADYSLAAGQVLTLTDLTIRGQN